MALADLAQSHLPGFDVQGWQSNQMGVFSLCRCQRREDKSCHLRFSYKTMGFNTQMVSFWLIWGAQILGNPETLISRRILEQFNLVLGCTWLSKSKPCRSEPACNPWHSWTVLLYISSYWRWIFPARNLHFWLGIVKLAMFDTGGWPFKIISICCHLLIYPSFL